MVQISRRQILIAGATAAAFTTAGLPRSQATSGAVQDQLAALEDLCNCKVGLFGRNLASNRTVEYRADDLFATCSTVTVYLAAQILLRDQRGELRLRDEVYIDPNLFVPVASPMTQQYLGGWMSLSDLCAAAVRQSDATAANLLLELLGGPPNVTDFVRSVGDDRSQIMRWETESNSAVPGEPHGTTSPRGMGIGLHYLLTSGRGRRHVVFNVEDYGVDLSGVTASDAEFQEVLHAAAASAEIASPSEVLIPPGVLRLTTRPRVGSGVTIRGAGRGATTIRSSNAAGVLELTGASDITVTDLTVESTAIGMTSIGISGSFAGLQKRVSITNCNITGTTNNALRFPLAVQQLTFTDNLVEDCESGFSLYAPTVSSGLISTEILVARNQFRNVGSVNIGLYGGTNALTSSTIIGAEISGNDLRDFAQTGASGPIPIELTCVTNLRIADNSIDGPATRGISMGSNVNTIVTGNTIRGQTIYAFELNGGRRVSIVGNTVENCNSFANDTADPILAPTLSDIVIADNLYFGSGQTSTQETDAVSLRYVSRARITGNVFNNWQYLRGAIRLGDGASPVPEDCVVEGNTFVISDTSTPLNTISVRSAIRTNVVRNTLHVNRDLMAGDDGQAVITAVMDQLSVDTLIAGNHIIFTGAVTESPSASGIGNNIASAGPCAGLTVCRNHIENGPRGIRLVTTSSDLAVYGNDTSTCVEADVIPATASKGPPENQALDSNGEASVVGNSPENAVNHYQFSNTNTGNALDEPHRAQLEEWMRHNVSGANRIRAGLPSGWTIAEATGAGAYASTNDVGLAYGPAGEQLVLAVMTQTRSGDPEAPVSNILVANVVRAAVTWLLA